MNDNLQATLNNLINSGSGSNPAMNTLINDYTTYHVVFVVAGGLLVIIFVLLSLYFWTHWKRVPKTDKRKWTFEKKLYFAFGALSILVGLMIALITAANATNVVDPRHGFSLLPDSISTPIANTQKDQLYHAFNTWLQSGSDSIPSIIQNKIHERVAFHTTKALVCAVLLVLFVGFGTSIWNRLIKQSNLHEAKWRLRENALVFSGIAMVTLSLLMMVIVVANTQAAFGPLTLTLLYG
ncbi:MAG: hypothetical protein GC179_19610 [Anaerolineaceae bacterium]|nr:hypothetical protein [Anaerolineaceae bacterium]